MSFNLAVMLRQSRNAGPDYPLRHMSDPTGKILKRELRAG